MENTALLYENVFTRDTPKEIKFLDFLNEPEKIYEILGKNDFKAKLKEIKSIADKEQRNIAKREYLPCVDLSNTGVLSIDIDGISDKPLIIERIIQRLSKLETCLAVKESVSGNIVAFFKYECMVSEYKFLYYKIYLELVLLLSVNIDFLPEIGRLRYVSNGKPIYLNLDSEILTEIIEVDEVPYINTQVENKKARRIVYGSR